MSRLIPTRRARVILGSSALSACLIAWLSAQAADNPEAREIKMRLSRQAQAVQSLDVSYKLEARTPLKSDQLLAMSEFRNQLFLPRDEWRIAFKGTKRYSRQIQPEQMNLLRPPNEY